MEVIKYINVGGEEMDSCYIIPESIRRQTFCRISHSLILNIYNLVVVAMLLEFIDYSSEFLYTFFFAVVRLV